jgi:hypothetical protein
MAVKAHEAQITWMTLEAPGVGLQWATLPSFAPSATQTPKAAVAARRPRRRRRYTRESCGKPPRGRIRLLPLGRGGLPRGRSGIPRRGRRYTAVRYGFFSFV